MKKMKSLLVALVLIMGATSFVNAQKMAHIDTQALIESMPETKAAQNELERIRKTFEAEISSMLRELQSKYTLYESEANTKTEDENRKRAEELQSVERKIGEYRQNASTDLQKKEGDLFSPLFEKAKKAIEKVAKDKGVQYVMDATPGSGLIVAEGEDLLAAVKRELGI
jgi:outer membrane protein